MGNKFFNKKLNRNCGCCVYGEQSEYSSEIFCRKHGVCDKQDCCRHYKYDVLKREPERIVANTDFSKEDFEL